jgi:glycine cleavage system protein P-like pyridoxal-binding family
MQSNSEYLTLALDVRKITDSLIRLVKDGTTNEQQFAESIHQVLASLQGGTQTSVRSLRERGPFGRYVSVLAIKEVFNDEARKTLVGKLNIVIQPTSAERTNSALAAIPFFDALERRALYHHKRAQTAKRYTPTR